MIPYKLLIKFPTRERPEKFFSVLDMYVTMLDNKEDYQILVSCDTSDSSMNNEEVIKRLKTYKNLKYSFDDNKNKVEAINSRMTEQAFDIVLLASDDMIPQIQGYDDAIRRYMYSYFPDTDGVLWFADGYQNENLNTLVICGKKYFDRFEYIYHPAYKSLWCDNEFTIVASRLQKQIYISHVIIKHEHVYWKGEQWDDLQLRNEEFNDQDQRTFHERLTNNFN